MDESIAYAQRTAAAYEDAWYYMWRERTLPLNVDPLKSEVENKEERERIAKVFDQGLKAVIGYAYYGVVGLAASRLGRQGEEHPVRALAAPRPEVRGVESLGAKQ